MSLNLVSALDGASYQKCVYMCVCVCVIVLKEERENLKSCQMNINLISNLYELFFIN